MIYISNICDIIFFLSAHTNLFMSLLFGMRFLGYIGFAGGMVVYIWMLVYWKELVDKHIVVDQFEVDVFIIQFYYHSVKGT